MSVPESYGSRELLEAWSCAHVDECQRPTKEDGVRSGCLGAISRRRGEGNNTMKTGTAWGTVEIREPS